MPTYEYVCRSCGHEFEQFQSMKDDPLKKCPKCEKDTLHRKIGTGAGIIFKGSGFYCTDYKGKNASSAPVEHSCGCGCGGHDHAAPADKKAAPASK